MYCMHEHTYQEKCHTIHILSVSAPLIYTSQSCHKYIYIYFFFTNLVFWHDEMNK